MESLKTNDKSTKYLSIIVPVFNGGATLERCLQAILNIKGYEECELIVADDNSTDSSLDIAKKYTDNIVRTPKNKGAAFTRNLGARAAVGNFLLFVDSDVVLSAADILSILKDGFLHPDICGIYGLYGERIIFNNFFSAYKHLSTCFGQTMLPPCSSFASSAILIVSRKDFFESGGFNENFPGVMAEDIEFSIRFALKTGKFWQLDERIKGCHHKKYSFSSLLRTDYLRIKGMAKAMSNKEYKISYLKSCPSSAFGPLACAFLSAVLFFSSLFYFNFLWPALVTLLLFFLTQFGFFKYFKKRMGIFFALLALSFSFCEMLLASVLAFYWQLAYKFKKQ